MTRFDRRAFLGMSVGAVSLLRHPGSAAAQTPACVPGGMAQFLPVRLTVDCASRLNFQLFRKNTDDVGLAGVVSMSFVRGKLGSYDAGSMIVFPWLKPKGRSREALPAGVPVNSRQFVPSSPIPDATLPLDEYLCNYRLQAPGAMFIGFQLDVAPGRARPPRRGAPPPLCDFFQSCPGGRRGGFSLVLPPAAPGAGREARLERAPGHVE